MLLEHMPPPHRLRIHTPVFLVTEGAPQLHYVIAQYLGPLLLYFLLARGTPSPPRLQVRRVHNPRRVFPLTFLSEVIDVEIPIWVLLEMPVRQAFWAALAPREHIERSTDDDITRVLVDTFGRLWLATRSREGLPRRRGLRRASVSVHRARCVGVIWARIE